MRACARIVAEADGRGGTRLRELYGEVPLLPRRTGPAQVHLVGGAAGPLGGDRLRLEVTVGRGACLTVRTVAATLALPGPQQSTIEVAIRVAAGASLRWLPEPLVAAAGCDHETLSTVELDATASLLWREELVLGRHGEDPGDVRTSLHVRLDGRTLLRQELAAGPRAEGAAGAAVLGGARTTGSILVVDPTWAAGPPIGQVGVDGALFALAGPAMLATAVAPDAHTLRTRLTALASTVTARQRGLHSIETNGDNTSGRPATPAGRA